MFSGAIGLINLPACHLKPVFISFDKMDLLHKTDCQIFIVNSVYQTVSFDGGDESLTFSVNVDRYVVIPAIYLLLFFKDLNLYSKINVTLS
jgi:hypothetical protein